MVIYCENKRCIHNTGDTGMCRNQIVFDDDIHIDEYGMCDNMRIKDKKDEMAD